MTGSPLQDESLSRQSPDLLTVALEDYFQAGAFNRLIQQGNWYRFEHRLERGARHTLDLLDEYGIKATFFVMGWVSDAVPELVREIASRGHEIASRGYYHRSIATMTPGEFRDDLARTRESLENASGTRVVGYRVADQWFGPDDLWALDVLANEGYAYDSSICPMLRRFRSEKWRRFAHHHQADNQKIWEFPISTVDVMGWTVPVAGGNYFRQLPHWFIRRAVAGWMRHQPAPFVMYFHSWELDPEQPRITAAPMHSRIRHYRNLKRMPDILRYYLERYPFASIAQHLGLDTPAPEPVPARQEELRPVPILRRQEPVTVVIPCYNEEMILPYLANTLRAMERSFSSRYELRFMFVDDCSTDNTWNSLKELFGAWPRAEYVRHERNRGVAASIMTGLRNAKTEIACSIDCDCTYDPGQIADMIPQLVGNIAMVTASPYHKQGVVRNVPPWRLRLSRSLSFLYRIVLRQKLATYTSCLRVYRRETAVSVQLYEPGFLGIAEHLARLDFAGWPIREHPAVLEVRLLGRSKMKLTPTILGHLGLLARLTVIRLAGKLPPVRDVAEVVDLSFERSSGSRVLRTSGESARM